MNMKFCFLFAFTVIGTALADNPVIIDTRFSNAAAGQIIATAQADPPLVDPSRISASAPSTIVAGTEQVGEMKPPFALITVKERENNPAAPANVGIVWSLDKVDLEPGRYRIQFRVGVVDVMSDAGNFAVGLLDGNGKQAQIHLGNIPHISFSDGKIRANTKTGIPYSPGSTYLLEMIVDTKQATWSASVDGESLQDEVALKPEILEQLDGQLRIGSVGYFSLGGMDNSRPGSILALSDVKMEKLP